MRWFLLIAASCLLISDGAVLRAEISVGTAVVDISPTQFPVLVNGGMTSRQATETVAPLNARAFVISDGTEKIAIVVVDSCMLPRPLLDDAKAQAERRTGIPANRILISATHTHTAPSSMGCLGTDVDPAYVPFLREKLAQAVEQASQNLQPARIGWGTINAADYTATRRWIYRSDRIQADPFGNPTVRANMHAGSNWDQVTGPSGPEDPDLTLIAFQSPEGKPIGVLANFSMHYHGGAKALHPDYFGLFSDRFVDRLKQRNAEHGQCVAAMSHGCSGDIWRADYQLPAEQRNVNLTIDQFTEGLLDLALQCYDGITYQSVDKIGMQEYRTEMKYRVPDVQRLEWSKRIVAETGDRLPQTRPEIYAREQVILDELQSTEIVLQAISLGDIAIATTPTETYTLTGYKVKLQSPLSQTMVIELANGGDGYIPPPEQHLLGGYNTWPARSAGLEVEAEPKMVQALLSLLEQVTGKSRRKYQQPAGKLVQTTQQLKPTAYYRLDEFTGSRAVDHSGNNRDGIYEPGVAFFLEGPQQELFSETDVNRAVHFTGGRLNSRLETVKDQYTVSFWVWNGMPAEARETCGWLFSRGRDYDAAPLAEMLGIQGTAGTPGTLVFAAGEAAPLTGKTPLNRWQWEHVVLVRDGDQVRVYLNGNPEPEIQGTVPQGTFSKIDQFFFAGRPDRQSGFEGRLDEIALFNKALSAEEIAGLSAPTK